MNTSTLNQVDYIFKDTIKYIGLDVFRFEITERREFSCTLNLTADLQLFNKPDEMDYVDYIQTVLAPIMESISNSEAAQLAKSDLNNVIKTQQERIKELEKKIEGLKDYETYYRMAKGLK